MSVFSMKEQNEIKEKLTEASRETGKAEYDCDTMEAIIKIQTSCYK